MVKVNYKQFNEVITYLLIVGGRRNYKLFTSSQLIDIYVGNNEEYPTLFNIDVPFLFITVSKLEIENIRQWDIPITLCEDRFQKGKPTTIISDKSNYPRSALERLNFKIIETDYYKSKDYEGVEEDF